MNRLDLLNELQTIDTRIEENLRTRRELEDRLADDSTLSIAKVALDAAQDQANLLRAKLRALELDAKGLEDKIKGVDSQLYGGRVSNPKELNGLEQDELMLKRRQGELEDQMLDLMVEVEKGETEIVSRRSTIELTQSERERSQAADRAKLAQVLDVSEKLTTKRENVRRQITRDDLNIYDQLYLEKKGRAVARVKNSACGTCGFGMPSGIASRVHMGELHLCPNCGRILVT